MHDMIAERLTLVKTCAIEQANTKQAEVREQEGAQQARELTAKQRIQIATFKAKWQSNKNRRIAKKVRRVPHQRKANDYQYCN